MYRVSFKVVLILHVHGIDIDFFKFEVQKVRHMAQPIFQSGPPTSNLDNNNNDVFLFDAMKR